METIIIRHANSMGNARITSDLNSDLTVLGYKQAQVTADFLSEYLNESWFYDEGEIYTSPYIRTLKTSWAIAEKLGLPVIQDWRLREIIQELGHYNEDSFPLFINKTRLWSLFELENDEQTISRLTDFVDFNVSHSGKIILISHGTPVQVLKSLYLNYNNYNYEMKELSECDDSFKNCCITHIKDGELLLDRYTEHLKENDCFI